ncbi:MAG: hypothetical protein MUC71_03250 [Steroidobacteraceae bacterium]|jgi:hypothetical protein|nr:hypothetical protein [Steroidobacteraceae bacterium]
MNGRTYPRPPEPVIDPELAEAVRQRAYRPVEPTIPGVARWHAEAERRARLTAELRAALDAPLIRAGLLSDGERAAIRKAERQRAKRNLGEGSQR